MTLLTTTEIGPGLRIRALDQGTGPAVLMLHGLGAAGNAWQLTLPALYPHFRCLAPDLPGFGESDAPAGFFSVAAYARAMLGWLDNVGVDRVSIVGNSFGALIGLEMAALDPARVARLVVIAPPGADEESMQRTLWVGLRWVRDDGLPRLETLEETRLISTLASDDLMMLANLNFGRARAFLPGLVATARYAGIARASAVRCPVLLLWGGADAIVPVGEAMTWHEALPQAAIAIVEGAGHSPQFDAADETNRILLEFLAR